MAPTESIYKGWLKRLTSAPSRLAIMVLGHVSHHGGSQLPRAAASQPQLPAASRPACPADLTGRARQQPHAHSGAVPRFIFDAGCRQEAYYKGLHNQVNGLLMDTLLISLVGSIVGHENVFYHPRQFHTNYEPGKYISKFRASDIGCLQNNSRCSLARPFREVFDLNHFQRVMAPHMRVIEMSTSECAKPSTVPLLSFHLKDYGGFNQKAVAARIRTYMDEHNASADDIKFNVGSVAWHGIVSDVRWLLATRETLQVALRPAARLQAYVTAIVERLHHSAGGSHYIGLQARIETDMLSWAGARSGLLNASEIGRWMRGHGIARFVKGHDGARLARVASRQNERRLASEDLPQRDLRPLLYAACWHCEEQLAPLVHESGMRLVTKYSVFPQFDSLIAHREEAAVIERGVLTHAAVFVGCGLSSMSHYIKESMLASGRHAFDYMAAGDCQDTMCLRDYQFHQNTWLYVREDDFVVGGVHQPRTGWGSRDHFSWHALCRRGSADLSPANMTRGMRRQET
jgi:hypothetical protein